ncbi:Serine proteinase stubble [Orchesella cincta]|uniref:Phenoloxidase-activating factor 2 n=1 Tax=Orchesella cincta TaxID=48709 RepID=A0A1D2NCX7_ORCCI|nr:Serine proteinase stubble [Orchesella cincta]
MRCLARENVLILALMPILVLAAPEPLKFPDSGSDSTVSGDSVLAAASTTVEQGSRDATKAIEEILSAARAGRNVGISIGDTNLDKLATDPELRKTLETEGDSGQEVQARNYISTKLCALGLAKCGEGRNYYGGNNNNGGGLHNIRDVTLVQPVVVKPVGHPIQAIPLQGSSRPFSPSNSKSDYPSLYPAETQGGFIQSSGNNNRGCSCVPVSQCNSYDIVSGPGGSSTYNPGNNNNYPPPYNPSNQNYNSNNNNYYPSNNNNNGNYNSNNGFITGTGRPSYGQVGAGIDPRNKLNGSDIESNATVVEASGSELNARSVPESSDSGNKTRVTRQTRDAPRVVSGGSYNTGGQCFDRQVCCRRPIGGGPQDRNPSYYPSNNNNNFNNFNNNNYPVTGSPSYGGGTCGKRNAYGINGRVVTGVQGNYGIGNGDTEFGEYPWQVAILRKEGADNVFVCGGSLIDSRHVLTAAHCIQSHRPQILRVRLGDWDVGGETEFYPHQDLDVAAIALHPDFNSGNLFNDVAIVKLDGYVDIQRYPHISPICLPDKYTDFSNKRCIVTGWGKDAWGHEGKFQHRLKEVDLPILNHYDCEQKLKRTKLGQNFVLHSGFVCAGGEPNRDACKGDGGGPLACEVNGVWQLAGIISWGVGCGEANVPGVYVKVSNYHDWIRQNIGF